MSLPCFYISTYDQASSELQLDEDNSRHVIQVLRMKPGELIQLTDGRGHLLEGEIVEAHKKQCRVAIRKTQTIPPPFANVTIAISPLKNASRFEWFLEKATEIGVRAIVPLMCERTERQSIRADRLRNILVSAMLQSQQAWLPVLPEPQPFSQLIAQAGNSGPVAAAAASNDQTADAAPIVPGTAGLKLIAHCLEAPRATTTLAALVRERLVTSTTMNQAPGSGAAIANPAGAPANPAATPANPGAVHPGTLILIGPEGDFTPKEVETALATGYLPVSLGYNRLRTETAGVVAAALLCIQ